MPAWVALIFVLSTCMASGAEAETPVIACSLLAGPVSTVNTASCIWDSPADAGRNTSIRIDGGRSSMSGSATPVLFAGQGLPTSNMDSPAAGLSLELKRLVLVGFDYAGAGSTAPLLWPAGLLDTVGATLNLTDVRLVTSNQELFNSWLKHFTSDSHLEYWTDNSTFLYIHQWAGSGTRLTAVGLLVQAPLKTPNLLELPPPLVQNTLVAATNSTLVPSLLTYASITTLQPLLVFITTNVTLGISPRLPAAGIPINRPVVFVGLQSLVTSVDFQMIVNQLNATGRYSNITFVGVVLENLAPGDTVTSMVAAPFSIAISNNVWAAYYNRSVANDVRLTLFNSTLVLPLESEMAYVTFMLTMYTSSLPYLRQQTSFYSDVLHMTILQFSPGPGSRAITVTRLKSWYSLWRNVVLTTDHVVAAPLPLPPRQLVLQSPTRASPLVQAVHSADNLKSSAEMAVVGDRAHILLLLANISMDSRIFSSSSSSNSSSSGPSDGSASNPIQLNSVMSWIGASAADAAGAEALPGGAQAQAAGAKGAVATVTVGFDYLRSAVIIPDGSPRDALQMQQLVLTQLPQGAGVASSLAAGHAHVPAELWTMLVWSVQRPLQDKTLNLDGVHLLLPEPELAYIAASAAQATDFVIELAGNDGNALTFQKVMLDGSNVRVGTFQGPGMTATNLTLGLDPAAVTAMPGGYVWPDPATLPQPVMKHLLPPWVIAVIAVAVLLAVCMVALGGFLLYRSQRLPWCLPRGKHSLLEAGSMRSGSACSYPRRSIDSANFACSPGSQIAGQKVSRVVSSEARLAGDFEACTTGTQDSVSDMTAGQKVRGHLVLNSAAEQKAKGALKRSGEPALRQRSSSSDVEVPRQVADACEQRDAPMPVHVEVPHADSVAAGMQRWRAAVSSTTMLLMERRLDAANLPLVGSFNAASIPSSTFKQASNESRCGGSSTATPENGKADAEQQAALERQASDAGLREGSGVSQYGLLGTTPPQLQLLELLGQGSCGCVYLAMWRGKRVAVKVMHLPANALLGPQGNMLAAATAAVAQAGVKGDADSLQQRRRARVQQQNSAPHMAIMEAVLSSTMCHPNVVQVYTYMLNPLTRTSSDAVCSSMQNNSAAGPKGQDIAGWELKLVMEYCNEGSLRDALDCGVLAKPGGFPPPAMVLTLAHDVAAAMLHLHSEGIVHADLKAANVMLTAGGEDLEGVWVGRPGGRRLIAKVADFGLAMPLDPSDTHATLSARGTPTHMSPELFMSGHVSKAGDVWAFGILLYELITGQRAYAGVPIPLLPHEVARQGLRPTWPDNLPPGCRDLRKLAESCWMLQPQDRPSFADIMQVLDLWVAGGHGFPLAQAPTQAAATQQQQQQQQQQETAAQQAVGPAAASAAVLQRRQVQIQVQVQGDQQQQQQQQGEDVEQQPGRQGSGGQLAQNRPSSPAATVGRAGAGRVSPAAGRQQTGQGRHMHMDWSEVDFAA